MDPPRYRLDVDGLVGSPPTLDVEAIRDRPGTSVLMTMECAGNGRARLLPRPVSEPGSSRRSAPPGGPVRPLAPILRESSLRDDAVEVVFTRGGPRSRARRRA